MVIPEGVTKINEDAFSGCHSLTSVTIPASMTEIVPWAFQDCISLTDITIPKGVAVIEMRAFQGCTGLKTVTVPRDTDIGLLAFVGCEGLADERGMVIVKIGRAHV